MIKNKTKISPTAWGLASHRKNYTDIPLSVEIFDAMAAINAKAGADFDVEKIKEIMPPGLLPIFEARYKLTDKILQENNMRQILEVAVGFSQRGFVMARDASINFSELDLPEVMAEKKAVAASLVNSRAIPEEPNLYFYEGDALNWQDLLRATENFDVKKSIAVTNEGLLRYLNLTERRNFSENILLLLKKFSDGIWVTPDTCTRYGGAVRKELSGDSDEKLKRLIGYDVRDNYFENENESQKFFEKIGFSVEKRGFMEVFGKLISINKLNLDPEKIKEVLNDRSVFIMRPR